MKKRLLQVALPITIIALGVVVVMLMNHTASNAKRIPQGPASAGQPNTAAATPGNNREPVAKNAEQRPRGRGGRFGATTSATVASLTLTPGDWSPQLIVFGKTFSYQQRQMLANIAGEIEQINVNAGQRVAAGEQLLTLDDEDLQRLLAQAVNQLDSIVAQIRLFKLQAAADQENLKIEQALLAIQQAAVKRYENLTSQQLSSSNDYETALSGYQNQLKAVQAQQLAIAQQTDELARLVSQQKEAQLEVEALQAQVADAAVYAPFSGLVAALDVEVGDQVIANQQLLTLFDDQQLGLATRIPLAQALPILQTVEPVTASASIAGQSAELRLTDIESIAAAGSLAARFQFQGPVVIALGEHEPLTVELPAHEGVFAAPATSLYENRLIYKIEQQRLVDVEVTVLGQTLVDGATWYIFESPQLQAGDSILVTRLPNASRGLPVSLPQAQS